MKDGRKEKTSFCIIDAQSVKKDSGLKSPDKNFRNLFPIVKQHF